MFDDTIIDKFSIKHAYIQVADAIAAHIEDGRCPIKLPSERALAQEFGVSYMTARHAIAILRERGLIVSIHGRGNFRSARLSGCAGVRRNARLITSRRVQILSA